MDIRSVHYREVVHYRMPITYIIAHTCSSPCRRPVFLVALGHLPSLVDTRNRSFLPGH